MGLVLTDLVDAMCTSFASALGSRSIVADASEGQSPTSISNATVLSGWLRADTNVVPSAIAERRV